MNEAKESVSTGPSDNGPWYCYFLRNAQPQYRGLTYIGSTNDPRRRLRQHNEEISGGARYTHGRGGGWEIYALVTGFPNHVNALSCEWRCKKPTGNPRAKPLPEYKGVAGRIRGLNHVVRLERWTGQCIIDNKDFPIIIYLAPDMIKFFDMNELPENVTVNEGIPKF
jgi:structure-specific endonuclease subunit SLX1